MKTRIFALCIAAVLGFGSAAFADDFASAWSPSLKSEARLISGGAGAGGTLLAGIQIHLAPNTLTYWRNPGEAGVPPIVNFEGSQNLKSAQVLYPAPNLLSEGGVMAYGYMDAVIFPVVVTPMDAAQPVTLHYRIDYATCEKICVPATAEGELMLQKPILQNRGGSHDADIRTALARVPQSAVLNSGAALDIVAVSPAAQASKPQFDITVAAPDDADLFAEGPEGVYVTVKKTAARAFVVTFDDTPAQMQKAPLKLTLVTRKSAIETLVEVNLKP